MTETPRHTSSLQVDRTVRMPVSSAPYAGPVRTASARPIESIATAPYIPAPFRGKPRVSHIEQDGVEATDVSTATHDEHTAVELPWIDAFLEGDTSRAGVVDAEATVDRVAPSVEEHESAATNADAATVDDEGWPLADAGTELRKFGEAFAEHVQPTPEALFDGGIAAGDDAQHPAVEPKPMWNGDEWMDIMPVARAAHEERRDAPANEEQTDAAHAATMLESIARRVRAGELLLPGYHSDMDDAATVAAALTALLGRAR